MSRRVDQSLQSANGEKRLRPATSSKARRNGLPEPSPRKNNSDSRKNSINSINSRRSNNSSSCAWRRFGAKQNADKELERYHDALSNLLRRALRMGDARKILVRLQMEQAARTLQHWFRRVLVRIKARILAQQRRVMASKTLRAYLEAMRCRKQFAQKKVEEASSLSRNVLQEVRHLNNSMKYAGRYGLPQQLVHTSLSETGQLGADLHELHRENVPSSPRAAFVATPRFDASRCESESPSARQRRMGPASSQSRPSSRGRSPEDIRSVQRWMVDNHRMAQCLYLNGNVSKNVSTKIALSKQDDPVSREQFESPRQCSVDDKEQALGTISGAGVQSRPPIPRLCLDAVKATDESPISVAGVDMAASPKKCSVAKAASSHNGSLHSMKSGRSPKSRGNSAALGAWR